MKLKIGDKIRLNGDSAYVKGKLRRHNMTDFTLYSIIEIVDIKLQFKYPIKGRYKSLTFYLQESEIKSIATNFLNNF